MLTVLFFCDCGTHAPDQGSDVIFFPFYCSSFENFGIIAQLAAISFLCLLVRDLASFGPFTGLQRKFTILVLVLYSSFVVFLPVEEVCLQEFIFRC